MLSRSFGYCTAFHGTLVLSFLRIDGSGRQVLTARQTATKGPITFGLPLTALGNGMYVLQVVDGHQRYQQRFFIQHWIGPSPSKEPRMIRSAFFSIPANLPSCRLPFAGT
ncbi:MAG: T9SS type A sorting domain-containing protein [Flavobacteriales bacterium]|nr:T9SS type A sorting domain-containing protein [Flavobacteriales bacterium]